MVRLPVAGYFLPDWEPTKEGISTSESRGSEIMVFPLEQAARIIIESVRLPSAEPVWSFFFSSSVMPSRLSEPTIRYVVQSPSLGRSMTLERSTSRRILESAQK